MSHQITDETFEAEVLKSDVPVVVDFWAPWCGPCRALGPIVEELAEEFAGRVKVAKINTDENQRAASALGISAIPALLFFKGGRLVDTAIGVMPREALRRQISRLL